MFHQTLPTPACSIASRTALWQADDERLAGLHKELFCEANPIPTKWALTEMGLIEPGIRLPLTWLSAACHKRVRQAMEQAGVGKV